MRKSGIPLLGDLAWGTHFCQFYNTPQDLIDILVPYFKEGLLNNEYCMWVTSDPLGVADAAAALKAQVPDLEKRRADGQIEIIDFSQWYTASGTFDPDRVLKGWVEKQECAIKNGFDGLRLTGNTFWLPQTNWTDFEQYEETVNNVIGQYRILALCTYSLEKCGSMELLEVVKNHNFALIKNNGQWQKIESSDQKKTHSALERGLRRFELLSHISGMLLQASEPQKVVESLCRKAMEHLDCHAFFNFLVDDDAGKLHLNACAGIPDEDAKKIEWLDYGTAVCGCAARDGCRIVAEHIPTTPDPRTALVESYGIKAYACHPLLAPGAKVIGTLSFGTRSRETFSDEDLSLMKAIADQVATAMVRMRTETTIRKLNEELEQKVTERTAIAERRASQLKTLASELTLAEREERKKLSHLLHDHLQQFLAAAKLKSSMLKTVTTDSQVSSSIQEVIDLLNQSIQCSRDLSIELSPPALNEAGLTAGLNWLAQWFAQKHSLTVHFKSITEIKNDIPEDIKHFVFNAAREMLFNVTKHAGTDRARMKLWHRNSMLCLTVSDEGVGIDARKFGLKATGLGLFSIKERIEILGGRLEVNRKSTRGCMVSIKIPVELEKTDLKKPRKPQVTGDPGQKNLFDSARKKIRVLLADDHNIMRLGLAAMLQRQPDIEIVAHAADGVAAVELASQCAPDIAVLDINMPRMNGIEAAKNISHKFPDIRVIGLSMHSTPDIENAMISAGACAYCKKDGPPEVLINAIRSAVVA